MSTTTPDLEAVKTQRRLQAARGTLRLAADILAETAGARPVNLIRLDLAIAAVTDAREELAEAQSAHDAVKAGCVL